MKSHWIGNTRVDGINVDEMFEEKIKGKITNVQLKYNKMVVEKF